jgi:ornithine carbamoyltransferase
MHSTSLHGRPLDFASLSRQDVGTLLACARTLQNAERSGTLQTLLRGKNLGLLCESANSDDAELFQRAALALGAHVAHLPPSLSRQSAPEEVQLTARMLGRLYDAVECQGMDSALVAQIGHEAGVPVYHGLAAPTHATTRLTELLSGDGSPADRRLAVLQAVLLCTLG